MAEFYSPSSLTNIRRNDYMAPKKRIISELPAKHVCKILIKLRSEATWSFEYLVFLYLPKVKLCYDLIRFCKKSKF